MGGGEITCTAPGLCAESSGLVDMVAMRFLHNGPYCKVSVASDAFRMLMSSDSALLCVQPSKLPMTFGARHNLGLTIVV